MKSLDEKWPKGGRCDFVRPMGAIALVPCVAGALLLVGCGGGSSSNTGGHTGVPQSAVGKVTGVITNQTTGQPIEGEKVLVKGTALSDTTDGDGAFLISSVPYGSQVLLLDNISGAQDSTQNITVASATDNVGTIALKVEGPPPPPAPAKHPAGTEVLVSEKL